MPECKKASGELNDVVEKLEGCIHDIALMEETTDDMQVIEQSAQQTEMSISVW